MKLMGTDMAEIVTEAARGLDTVDTVDTVDTHSLEALCRVWRQSRSDRLPHICSSLNSVVIHLNGESDMVTWSHGHMPRALSSSVDNRPLQSSDVRIRLSYIHFIYISS